jgi:hypothetical protein
MKSIKNQYIDLKEGKMSEAQFMRNVRMTLPEYISNVTLFKQAERILINKGIISEIKAKSPLTINGKVVKTYTQNSDKSYKVKYDEGGSETIMVSDKGWDDINTLRKNATNEPLNEVKDTSATGYYNQDGKEQYGKFDELDNMNAQEIMAGYVLEKIDKFDKFTFVCFPYNASNEIHGFEFEKMNSYANDTVDKVARGGFFGGSKSTIENLNTIYFS